MKMVKVCFFPKSFMMEDYGKSGNFSEDNLCSFLDKFRSLSYKSSIYKKVYSYYYSNFLSSRVIFDENG